MIVLLGLLMAKDIQYPAEAAEFQEKKIPPRSLGILKTSLFFVRSRLPAESNFPLTITRLPSMLPYPLVILASG